MLNDAKAIQPLRRAFEKVETKREKQIIAATLLSLGEREARYFDFLAKHALEAIRMDMPFPILLDEEGNIVRKQLDPAFVAWCEERGLDPARTSRRALYDLPGDVMPLTWARDSRATDIFREALAAPNFYIANQGIIGLAILREPDEIQEIVETIRRMPPQFRERAAAALMVFDNAQAHALAREFVPDEERLKAFLEFYQRLVP
ncbi:MAG TPA: hypothetical protein VLU25_12315 [Acidobacteriota bacterium]|nr:hypothetical protein [Acidobacteriota bacterium]